MTQRPSLFPARVVASPRMFSICFLVDAADPVQHGPATSRRLPLPHSLPFPTIPDHPMLPPPIHSLPTTSLPGGPSLSSAAASETFCPLPPASSLPLSTAEQTRRRMLSLPANTLRLPSSPSQILPSSSPSTRRTRRDGTPPGLLVRMHRVPLANAIQKQHISTQALP